MLSVIIPTRDAEQGLMRTLAALVPAAADGIVREVVVADGGSRDGTAEVAEAAGCLFVQQAGAAWGERIGQAVAAARRGAWLQILPPGIVLEGDWCREVAAFVERTERAGEAERRAAAFRLALDAHGWRARLAEGTVGVASSVLGLPLPQQGLVLSRRLWQRLRPVEDHRDLVGRIGRRSIHVLRARAVALSIRPDGRDLPEGGAIARHALAALGLPVRAAG